MELNLYEELLGPVDVLERSGLEHAICGGVALAFHGHPRFTLERSHFFKYRSYQARMRFSRSS